MCEEITCAKGQSSTVCTAEDQDGSTHSTSERPLSATDDILCDLFDLSQCSLDTASESLFFLDSALKQDLWDDHRSETLQSVDTKFCSYDMTDSVSVGALFKCHLAASGDCRCSSETPPCGDSHSVAVNSSTLDVLDYLENSQPSSDLRERIAVNYSTSFKLDTLISRNEVFCEVGNNYEQIANGSVPYMHSNTSQDEALTKNYPDEQADVSHMAAWNSTLQTGRQVTCRIDTLVANSGTCWRDCSALSLHTIRDLSKSDIFSTSKSIDNATESTSSKILSKNDLTVALSDPYSLQLPQADSGENTHIQEKRYTGLQLDSKSELSKNYLSEKRSVQVMGKSKNSEAVFFRLTTPAASNQSHQPFLSNRNIVSEASYQSHQPFSSNLNIVSEESSKGYLNVNSCKPSCSSTANKDQSTGSRNLHKANLLSESHLLNQTNSTHESHPSSKANSSESHPPNKVNSLSHSLNKGDSSSENHLSVTQEDKTHDDDDDRLVSCKKTYIKVGKRGRFVLLPVEKVNKLMVRDLLNMSGNKEETDMKEKTLEYRRNIQAILQQKRKRLSVV